MPDMLVNLLNLPPVSRSLETLGAAGIIIRRPLPHEAGPVRDFVKKHFGRAWADEIIVGYANKPISLFIATKGGKVVGFGAYDCTCRAFFGPTGVLEAERHRGIGSALLLAGLWGLRENGYAYGIIGSAGPTEFYRRTVGAIPIEGSEPGIYADPLEPAKE